MCQALQISLFGEEHLKINDLFASIQLVVVYYNDIAHPHYFVLDLITICLLIFGELLFADLFDGKHKLVFD